jgi:hypothetical protein
MKLTKYQKGVYYLCVKVFNMHLFYIKIKSDNPKKSRLILQWYLYENSLYSVDEYFKIQNN